MAYEVCSLNTKDPAEKAHGFLLSSALPVSFSFKEAGISPGDIVCSALKLQSDQWHTCDLHGFHITALEYVGLVGVRHSCCAYSLPSCPEVLKRRRGAVFGRGEWNLYKAIWQLAPGSSDAVISLRWKWSVGMPIETGLLAVVVEHISVTKSSQTKRSLVCCWLVVVFFVFVFFLLLLLRSRADPRPFPCTLLKVVEQIKLSY